MKIAVTFTRTTLAELEPLRREYFDYLSLAQEPSLEVLMPDADHYAIFHDGARCGYFSVHAQNILIELYLIRSHWVFGECVVAQLLERTEIQRAWVKSFDALLFSSCVARVRTLHVKGLLVRDIVARAPSEPPSTAVTTRTATHEDLPRILAVDQQVFRHPERLQRVVGAGFVQLFEQGDSVVGFGIARPVVAGRPDVELGIAVDKPFRTRGLSSHLLHAMIQNCLAKGLRPVAGVAVENEASRAMGERAGMVANHRLLDLEL